MPFTFAHPAAVLPLRLGHRGQREVALFELGHAPGTCEEDHAEQPAHKGRRPSARKIYKRAVSVTKKSKRRQKRNNGG